MLSQNVVNTLDFPSPKFYLGQAVQCEFQGRGKTQKREGVVIGLEYLSIEYALVDQTGECGWRYTISTMVGKPDTEWLRVSDSYDVQWNCIESEMAAVAVASCERDLIPAGKVA